MTRLSAALALLLLACGAAHGGLFGKEVAIADLAQVPPEMLDVLQPTEFDVLVAEVEVEAARTEERRAESDVRDARRELAGAQADLKAAKAESKAAQANQDQERASAAAAMFDAAEDDRRTAEQLLRWKQQELVASQAWVKQARAALELAEVRRDAARVQLLLEAGVPARDKYDLNDLQDKAAKREQALERAHRRAEEAQAQVPLLQAEWERMVGEAAPVETP